MDAAIAKIPLYPGWSSFRLDGRDYETDFYVVADYADTDLETIDEFYREYFRDNGWTNSSSEEEAEGPLLFEKDKVQMHVTLMDLQGQTNVMVMYNEREHTHAEFNTLVRERASPEALDAVKRIADAYAAISSYADTGTQETIDDGEVLSRARFNTAYRAPEDLLFQFSDSMGGSFQSTHTLSKRGDSVRYQSNYDTEPRVETDVSIAIGALYGVTSTTSGNVPYLLLGLAGESALFHLANLKLLEEARTPDGTKCLRLNGKDFNGAENTIWVATEDSLIRRIESVQDDNNYETVTYRPQINIEIAPEDLAFEKPVAVPVQ